MVINNIYNKIFSSSFYKKNLKYFLPNYTNILYILGYGWDHKPIYLDNNIDDNDKNTAIISISILNDNLDINEKITNKNYYIRTFINYIYISVITCLLSWNYIYSIIYSLIYCDFKYLTDNMFQLLFITQYIFGYVYFSKNHLYDILKSNTFKPLTYTFWLYIAIFCSIIFTSLTVILLNVNQDIIIYSQIINSTSCAWIKILINVLLFVEKFFSYLCFFVNMITFSYVKIHNKKKIESFNNTLSSHSTNSISHIVNIVSEEFFKMRKEHNLTIDNLNYIFSSANITGLIALYFTIKNINNKTFYIMEIINVIIFLVIESIYLYCINSVKQSIDNIKEEMVSVNSISQIFNKSEDFVIINNNNKINDIFEEMNYHSKISAIESVKSAETLTWIIMKDILDSEWDSFKFLGFTIDDSYIIQKIFGIILTIMIAKDLSDGFSILK